MRSRSRSARTRRSDLGGALAAGSSSGRRTARSRPSSCPSRPGPDSFTSSWSGPLDAGAYRELPGTIRVIEQPTDDEYRSILGEWGQADPRAIFELLEPPTMPTTSDGGDDAGDTPEEATPLEAGMQRGGRAARSEDVDWYALTVPEGDNTLELVTRTTRAGDVRLRLVDATGLDVPVTSGPPRTGGPSAGRLSCEPGANYRVEVVQPVLSVVVTFDTSGSVWPWFPALRAAVRELRGRRHARPGGRAGPALRGDRPPRSWSDQPYLIGGRDRRLDSR